MDGGGGGEGDVVVMIALMSAGQHVTSATTTKPSYKVTNQRSYKEGWIEIIESINHWVLYKTNSNTNSPPSIVKSNER